MTCDWRYEREIRSSRRTYSSERMRGLCVQVGNALRQLLRRARVPLIRPTAVPTAERPTWYEESTSTGVAHWVLFRPVSFLVTFSANCG